MLSSLLYVSEKSMVATWRSKLAPNARNVMCVSFLLATTDKFLSHTWWISIIGVLWLYYRSYYYDDSMIPRKKYKYARERKNLWTILSVFTRDIILVPCTFVQPFLFSAHLYVCDRPILYSRFHEISCIAFPYQYGLNHRLFQRWFLFDYSSRWLLWIYQFFRIDKRVQKTPPKFFGNNLITAYYFWKILFWSKWCVCCKFTIS